jgi:hypothetical protein
MTLFARCDGNETYGSSTAKTITMLKQVKPSIFLALHYAPDVVDEVLKTLKITDRSETDTLAINKKDIQSIKGTKYVFMN